MIEQEFGPRRCRDSRKPALSEQKEVEFYYCSECKSVFAVNGAGKSDRKVICCEKEIEKLNTVSLSEAGLTDTIGYKIVGGYNDNAVQVTWKSYVKDAIPEWIYLKTFTGGYLKRVYEGKRSPMIFALADLDAFAYCDEDPCLECTFRCKRGFVIYVFIKDKGLIEIPLDKMNPYWQSES